MSDIWIRALVLVLIFAVILLVAERLIGSILSERAASRERNARLQAIAGGATRAEAMSRLRRDTQPLVDRAPDWLRPMAGRAERLLTRAGTAVPLPRLAMIMIIAPVALFLILSLAVSGAGLSLSAGRLFLLLIIALAAASGLPIFWLQLRANKRRRKFQEQFPIALDIFIRGLRAGHPISAALDLLTTELQDPLGSEFGLVVDEVTYGAELTDALYAMAERWDIEDVRMFVVSLSVQNETGGNLAEILDNLNRVIRERAQLLLKVRALSSEGRVSALMLTLLPVATVLLLFVINPTFYLEVAEDPLFVPGMATLVIMYFIGLWMIRKMVDLKV
jgi:tight adherence protein B